MIVRANVNFDRQLQLWDGFGFNYVETAQTVNYRLDPQDYGGFSILPEEKKSEIIDLIFGEKGLRPQVIKMFLDPFHQEPGKVNPSPLNRIDPENYNHATTTRNMVEFVKRGLEATKKRGDTLRVITTLYGPPPFMTRQRIMRGRDLDPAMKVEYAKYAVSWVRWLKEQGIPIRYISLHNEGEDYHRWPEDGQDGNIGTGHDYNLYWPPEELAAFMALVREVLDANGLSEIGVTPGETTNWTRFYNWGYAEAIMSNPAALKAIGLITSHGFSAGAPGLRWHGDHRSAGRDLIEEARPELHCWTTSTSWAKMDAAFVCQLHGNIYGAKCNAIIPWAGIQRPVKWVGGDPNPGNAIAVSEDGNYQVRDGYYYYKQVTMAGRAGMRVAQASATAGESCVIAFAGADSGHPNAFVIVNASQEEARYDVRVQGHRGEVFDCVVTDADHRCTPAGKIAVKNGVLTITLAPNAVVTLTEEAPA